MVSIPTMRFLLTNRRWRDFRRVRAATESISSINDVISGDLLSYNERTQQNYPRMEALDLQEDIEEFLEERSNSSATFSRIFYTLDWILETPRKCPRASPSAISRLPLARIFPFDKERLDQQNYHAECSVCMERLIDGIAVSRMPCGHVFHINCIVSWLGQSCACPECRYEMETMDPRYEIGRRQRMKDRTVYLCDCKTNQTHHCFFPQEEAVTPPVPLVQSLPPGARAA
jgi:Ring finger domain